MKRSGLIPYCLLLAVSALFFWKFTFLGKIPIDSTPFYQMRPWSAVGPVEPTDTVRRYPTIDPIVEVFPIKKWMTEQLRKWEAPLWTPAIFSGSPFAANHHAAPWDFSTPLFLLFPVDLAFGWTLLIQLFAAGASAFFLCRVLEYTVRSSLLGATAFMFNSFFLHWLGLVSFNAGLIWMPLIPAGIELCCRRNSMRYSGISAAALGLTFLSGMGQFWLFNVVLFASYGTYRIASCGWTTRRAAAFLLAGTLGAGLGAVQIASTASVLPFTSRGGETQASVYEGRNHLSPRRLPTLLIPDLYGHCEENVFSKLILNAGYPEAKGWTGRLIWGEKGTVFNRAWGYIGIPAFFLMLIGFWNARGPARFFGWLAAVVILFQVLLCWELFHDLCTKLWSGFDTLDHTRTIVLYVLAASILAAQGMEFLSGQQGTSIRRLIAFAAAGCLALIAILHAIPLISNIPALVQQSSTASETFSAAFYQDAGTKIAMGFHQSAQILYAPLTILAALYACLRMLSSGRWTATQTQTAILLLSLFDLTYRGWTDPPLEYTERARLYPAPQQVIEFLQKDTDTFRVYELHRKRPLPALPLTNYGDLQIVRRGAIRFFDPQSVEFVLRPNVLMAYGIDSAGGYMSLYPGRYKNLWSGRGMDTLKALKPGQSTESWNAPWIGMQNIKYILAPQEQPSGSWNPDYSAGGVKVLKVNSYLPRIHAVPRMRVLQPDTLLKEIRKESFDPGREVLLEEAPAEAFSSPSVDLRIEAMQRAADTIQFSADMSADGYLVIAENYFPGWRATVDGKEQNLLAANYVQQCLPLRSGKHRIHLEFRPAYYTMSLFISLVSAVLVLLSALLKDPDGNKNDHSSAAVL